MKKVLSLILALALCLGLSVPATAVEEESENEKMLKEIMAIDGDDVPLELIEKYYTLTEEELNASLIPLENRPVKIRRATTQKVGPFRDIATMPIAYAIIMLDELMSQQGAMIYANQQYQGVTCYLFSNGSTDVYVAATAFYTAKNGTFPSDASVSSALTTYTNNKNTDAVSSIHMESRLFEASGLYDCTITSVATQLFGFHDGKNTAKSVYNKSIYLQSAPEHLLVGGAARITCQPELTVKMTNGGSNNTYFGGFTMQGLGSSVSTSAIGTLIDLGYNTAQLFSGTFTFGTVKSILGEIVSLTKSSGNGGSLYRSDDISLSNPYKNIYARQCSMQSPYELAKAGHYFQLEIGLLSNSTNAKYSVTVRYHF